MFPRLRHALLDAEPNEAPSDATFAALYAAVLHEQIAAPDEFLAHRYAEGRRWRNVTSRYRAGGRLLDIGGGNGAVELAFAADPAWTTVSIETEWNEIFRELRDRSRARLRRVVGDAARLPFRRDSFDAITLLETIEHLHDPASAAAEAARVLRDEGVLLMITPPRLRFAFRRDPHFGIRGLLLLPASLQRRVAARRGYTRPDHYVDRIYSSTKQLERVFRGFRLREVLSRSRAPHRWFWDAIVFGKRATPSASTRRG